VSYCRKTQSVVLKLLHVYRQMDRVFLIATAQRCEYTRKKKVENISQMNLKNFFFILWP
jgi:hypothetical protein